MLVNMDPIFKVLVFLGLMLMTVVADDCAPYVGPDFTFHQPQTCILSFCAGSCTNRYCSIIPGTMLDQSQFMCLLNNLYVVIGAGVIISLLIVVGLIACFCRSLFACCGLCSSQPRSARVNTSVAVTNVIPQQPLIHMPAVAAGYQPVSNHSMYAGQHDKGYLPPPYPGADNFAYVDSP